MASCDKTEIRSVGASRPDCKRRGGMRPHEPDFGNTALREAGTRKHGLKIAEVAALDPNSRPSHWAKAADIHVVRGAGMIDAAMMPPAEVRAGTDGTSPEISRAAAAGAPGQVHRPLPGRARQPCVRHRAARGGVVKRRLANDRPEARSTDVRPIRRASASLACGSMSPAGERCAVFRQQARPFSARDVNAARNRRRAIMSASSQISFTRLRHASSAMRSARTRSMAFIMDVW